MLSPGTSKHVDGGRRQWYRMLLTGLRVLCRNGPNAFVEIELVPFREPDFTRSTGGQNKRLHRQTASRGTLPQASDQLGHFVVRHCREMAILAGLTRQPLGQR